MSDLSAAAPKVLPAVTADRMPLLVAAVMLVAGFVLITWQVDLRPEGAFAHALEDADRVEEWRQQAGLPSLARHLQTAGAGPRPTPEAYAAQQADEQAWRRRLGWA